MKKSVSFLINRHQEILRFGFWLLVAGFIIYLIPKTPKFKYEFEKGAPWKYETLLAPFSFAIEKSNEEIEIERQQIVDDFQPYYRKDTAVERISIQEFKNRYNQLYGNLAIQEGIARDSLKHIRWGVAQLQDAYRQGIVQLHESHSHFKKHRFVHVLVRGNVAIEKTMGNLVTLPEVVNSVKMLTTTQSGQDKAYFEPLFDQVLKANVVFDDSVSQQILNEKLGQISPTRGAIQEGQTIISRGKIVSEAEYKALVSFKTEYEDRLIDSSRYYLLYAGYGLLVCLVFFVFVSFLVRFSSDVFLSSPKLAFVAALILIILGVVSFVVKSASPFLYAVPFCIVPILLKTYFTARLALQTHLLILLITGLMAPFGFAFLFIQLLAGLVSIFVDVKSIYWSKFFITTSLILVVYLLAYAGITVVTEGDIAKIDLGELGMLSLSAFLTLLAYPLVPVFEKLFGFVSEITLTELGDINRPLLKDLSLKAPGTFQHSLQVANLSEAAAAEIGANTLLVKIAALYHDIGKLKTPGFFIENQNTGVNPHDNLPFEKSAEIILEHVTEGVKMAKQEGLPDILIDFIRTHHGTSRVEYFYQNYLKNFPTVEVDESKFTYPGPLPYSRETAILMMADTVEAASRSLKEPTDITINNLVDKLIQQKIDHEQLSNSDITFKDITRIKKIFKKMLHSFFHVRIEYPDS